MTNIMTEYIPQTIRDAENLLLGILTMNKTIVFVSLTPLIYLLATYLKRLNENNRIDKLTKGRIRLLKEFDKLEKMGIVIPPRQRERIKSEIIHTIIASANAGTKQRMDNRFKKILITSNMNTSLFARIAYKNFARRARKVNRLKQSYPGSIAKIMYEVKSPIKKAFVSMLISQCVLMLSWKLLQFNTTILLSSSILICCYFSLIVLDTAIAQYRISKGYFGSNTYELKEILTFISENKKDIDFTDSGKPKPIKENGCTEEVLDAFHKATITC